MTYPPILLILLIKIYSFVFLYTFILRSFLAPILQQLRQRVLHGSFLGEVREGGWTLSTAKVAYSVADLKEIH